jgi:hypothetical protein
MAFRIRRSAAALAVLLAACGGDSGTAPIVVASVDIAAPGTSLVVGETMQLSATVLDAQGGAVVGRAVTWASSANGVAEVSPTGLVIGVGPGVATISATVDGRRDEVTLQVVSDGAPGVTSVSPTPLQEGQPATIQGVNFSTVPVENTVRIAGVPATVTGATASTLEIIVPGICLPDGPVSITVEVRGQTGAAVNHPLSAPAPASLRVGEQVILQNAADLCFRLGPSTAAERYLVGVQSTSEVVSTVTPVRLSGTVANSLAEAPLAQPMRGGLPTSPHSFGRQVVPSDPFGMRWRIHRRAERSVRIQEQRRLERRTGFLGATSASRAVQAARTTPRIIQLGDTVNLRVPDRADLCDAYTPVRAVARAVGQRGIWLDDILNPAGFTDANYAALSERFDADIYATTADYFGEPTDFDQNERVLILTTQAINRANAENPDRAILGFVSSTDFFPRDATEGCVSSNEGEIYYGVAPDPTGELGWEPWGEPYTVELALTDAPILIAHEFTHIIQLGRRIANPAVTTLQSVWELEGQATLAEEVVGHAVTGRRTGQDYGVEVALNFDEDPIDWYLSGFLGLVYYYGFESRTDRIPGAPEQCSWLDTENNGPCEGAGSLAYGVSWSFLRWLSDHFGPAYAGGEQELHRAMVDNVRQKGYQNITSVTGTPMRTLLAQWAAALYVDGRVAGADERLTFRSWNMANIFGSLVETATLQPRPLSFGTFSVDVEVRAASTAYFRVSGQDRPAVGVRAATSDGGSLPAHMQMWVVRLQ